MIEEAKLTKSTQTDWSGFKENDDDIHDNTDENKNRLTWDSDLQQFLFYFFPSNGTQTGNLIMSPFVEANYFNIATTYNITTEKGSCLQPRGYGFKFHGCQMGSRPMKIIYQIQYEGQHRLMR